ncbi:hypothetical protein Y032_0043g811 [Ancylostoma ceylanicum]|uniref:Uncharacterized protein n=1 Tax=Ancylostoma ceylanicum TaxID=53326 RepID=A0A016UFH8_9BILA|nr:hypothetical protein Y032_0043g811 [Ancylostoma ceylanicum]
MQAGTKEISEVLNDVHDLALDAEEEEQKGAVVLKSKRKMRCVTENTLDLSTAARIVLNARSSFAFSQAVYEVSSLKFLLALLLI